LSISHHSDLPRGHASRLLFLHFKHDVSRFRRRANSHAFQSWLSRGLSSADTPSTHTPVSQQLKRLAPPIAASQPFQVDISPAAAGQVTCKPPQAASSAGVSPPRRQRYAAR